MGKMNSKSTILNILGQTAVFLTNLVSSFFLTPFILARLGEEAFGFVGLINNFIGYLTILSAALNSMAGRYITLSYHRKDYEKAKKYYSSVFFSNVFMSGCMLVISIFLHFRIEHIISVPDAIIHDVKIAVFVAGCNTIISFISVVFSVAIFIKNRLYLGSIVDFFTAILRIICLFALFYFCNARIWYYSTTALMVAIISLVSRMYYTKKLTPELTLDIKRFDFKAVIEIIRSGVWVSIQSLNTLLQTGLDLLIANQIADSSSMGLLSVAKTIPTTIGQIPSLIANSFSPQLAELYAKNEEEKLVNMLMFEIKFLTFVMAVPMMGFVVWGQDFYRLWVPSYGEEKIALIYQLSVLTVLPLLANAYVECLYYINTLTDRVRGSVMITFIFSLLAVCIEILLLNLNIGHPLYIIAGTSSVLLVIRYLLVTPIYCSHILNIPRLTFFAPLIKSLSVSMLVFLFFLGMKQFIIINSWIDLIISCLVVGCLGETICFFMVFSNSERKRVIQIIRKKLRKGDN